MRARVTTSDAAQGPMEHDATNRLAERYLMLTDVENQGSERPFPGKKRKCQPVGDAVEGLESMCSIRRS